MARLGVALAALMLSLVGVSDGLAEGKGNTLANLKCVILYVEIGTEADAEKHGIGQASLEKLARAQLKSKMPRLRTTDPANSCSNKLYMKLDSEDTGPVFVYHVGLHLFRSGHLTETGKPYIAGAWSLGIVNWARRGFVSSAVREAYEDLFEAFAGEYYLGGNK